MINLESARSLAYPCRRLDSGYRMSRGMTVIGAALLLVAASGCSPPVDRTTADAGATSVTTASSQTTTVPPEEISPGQLCPATSPAREDAQALVDCLRTMISQYWTSAVGEPVQTTIVAGPEPETVPEACRDLLVMGSAFYCPEESTAYITIAMLDRNVAEFEEAYPYAVASTVAHEFGHVVQHVVHQPGIDQPPTPEESQALEQQADCSAGVWAADAVGAERLNAVTFRAAYEQALVIIGELPMPPEFADYDEVLWHGTVEERMVVHDAGFAAGTGTACGLIGID